MRIMSKLVKCNQNKKNKNYLEQITLLSYIYMLNYEENCICYKPNKDNWLDNYFIPDSFSTRLTLLKFNNIFDTNFQMSSQLSQEFYSLNIYFLIKLNLLNNIDINKYKRNKLPFIKIDENKIFLELINIYGIDKYDLVFIIKQFIKDKFNTKIEINSLEFKSFLLELKFKI